MLRQHSGRRETEATHAERPHTLDADLLKAQLLKEFAPILNRWGVPGWACYRRNAVEIGPALVDALQEYIKGRYLVEPTLCEGMTLGGAIDLTARAITVGKRRTA